MPVILKIDHIHHQVNVVAMGLIIYADAEAHMQHEEREHALAYRRLVDFRGAGIDLSPSEIRQIVGRLRNLAREQKLGPAAVMVSSDLAFGMMRMLEMLVEDFCDIRPFRDQAEAQEWLDAKSPSKV